MNGLSCMGTKATGGRTETMARRGAGALSVVVERLISGCGQQAGELRNLPFATIARIAAPNEVQGDGLEALRETAIQAAERLASDCPQSVPAAVSWHLCEHVEGDLMFPPAHSDGRRSCSRISRRCFSNMRRLPSSAWSIDSASSEGWPVSS